MTHEQKLYKIDTKGKTRVWWIEYDNEKYRTHAGIDGGKIVISGWQYPTEKNAGRSNATTVEQQVVAEVNAEYVKKQNQGKYHPTAKKAKSGAKFIECMLAGKYDPKKHTDFPYYSQPKLDGVRCIVSKDGMQSRNGKPIVSAPHILKSLETLFSVWPDAILDGELYNHQLKNDFETIISLARKTKPTDEDLKESEKMIQYHVYDIVDPNLRFEKRNEILQNIHGFWSQKIQPVRTVEVNSEEDIDNMLTEYLTLGYEGQMLRVPDSLYEGKRSKGLMKHKEFEDAEFEIVSVIEGNGNWAGCAKSVEIALPDGTTQFSGIRGSLDNLQEVLYNADDYIGTDVTVRYQNKTEDGKLRFPVVVAFWKGKRDI